MNLLTYIAIAVLAAEPLTPGDHFRKLEVDGRERSYRGGAVAMNIDSGDTPLVLLCPAWKKWGTATKVKPNTVILHSRADETVPFADSEELVSNSGLLSSALIEVRTEHRLADEESLAMMVKACEAASGLGTSNDREVD